MNEDHTAKLYAGQMGIIAVLVNVLIDKGVITLSELSERLEQAHEAASQCSGGPGVAVVLRDMLTYLEEPANRN
jgi:sugar diacid utilization regulator